jgi:transcriptional regulator with XRE-family HTH domain
MPPKKPRRAARKPVTGPELLIQWRDEHRLSQVDGAQRIGFDPATLNHIERGRIVPGMKRAVRIAQATGIPITVWEAAWRAAA